MIFDGGGATVTLDGRRFAAVTSTGNGQVDHNTVFCYRQQGSTIWADYAGGDITRGYLVGTRTGDQLDFRYVHLDTGAATATGHCHSQILVRPDGRIALHESWSWESRPGSGTSVVEEIVS